MSKPANRVKSRKPTVPKSAWPKGVSGNPAGAPKRGESWAEVIKQIGNMQVEEVVQMIANWLPTLKKAPKGITLKQLVVTRAFVGLANEPSASLMNVLMDRAEGKVPQPITGADEGPLEVLVRYAEGRDSPAEPASGAETDQA